MEVNTKPNIYTKEEKEGNSMKNINQTEIYMQIADSLNRIIGSIHKKYAGLISREEAFSAAYEAVYEGLNTYNPSHKIKVTSYLYPRIEWKIQEEIAFLNGSIRTPKQMRQNSLKVKKAAETLENYGEEVTIDRLEELTGLPKATVQTCLDIPEIVEMNESGECIDIENFEERSKEMAYKNPEEVLSEELMKILNAKEYAVIVRYYGICGFTQRSIEQIAYMLDMTRQGVNKVKNSAIEKIKNSETLKEMAREIH